MYVYRVMLPTTAAPESDHGGFMEHVYVDHTNISVVDDDRGQVRVLVQSVTSEEFRLTLTHICG